MEYDTNVGLGMVPHKKNCNCIECAYDRARNRNFQLAEENDKLLERNAYLWGELNTLREAARERLWQNHNGTCLVEYEQRGYCICGHDRLFEALGEKS